MAIKGSGTEYLASGFKQDADFADAEGHMVALDTGAAKQIKLATNSDNEIIIGVVEKGDTVAKGSRIKRLKPGMTTTMTASAAIALGAKISAANATTGANARKAGRAVTSAASKTWVGYAITAATAADDEFEVLIGINVAGA